MDREELNSKLLEAAEKGDTDKIWELIEQGADVNASDENGIIDNVPAILHNKHEMVEKSEHRMIVAVQNSLHDEIPPL